MFLETPYIHKGNNFINCIVFQRLAWEFKNNSIQTGIKADGDSLFPAMFLALNVVDLLQVNKKMLVHFNSLITQKRKMFYVKMV